jgi:hypothetical protein
MLMPPIADNSAYVKLGYALSYSPALPSQLIRVRGAAAEIWRKASDKLSGAHFDRYRPDRSAPE